jgi:hypothetical protein
MAEDRAAERAAAQAGLAQALLQQQRQFDQGDGSQVGGGELAFPSGRGEQDEGED